MYNGCSRHITGNLNIVINMKDIQEGYVAFDGNKGGLITTAGKVSNGRITFENMNYRDKVNHRLLSVSQIVTRSIQPC